MAAAREEGTFEVVISDANDMVQKTVKFVDTEVQMPASAETTPTERPFLEFGVGGIIPEQGKVKLYFTSKATDNIVAPSSKISIPVTKVNHAAGDIVFPAVLKASDFDDWNTASTTGIACAAGERQYLGTYQLGTKLSMKLGDRTAKGQDKSNARLLMVAYDDTA